MILISILVLCLVQFVACRPQTGSPCEPTPCGINTKCRVDDGRAICSCLATYTGNPIKGCKHDCENDSECPTELECKSFKCKDPCKIPKACADFATCKVVNHKADCRCPNDFNGDGFSVCLPECAAHEECPANRACIGRTCGDPCDVNGKSPCGKSAECRVENHKAICSCPKRWKGHPFEACFPPG